MAMTAAQLLAAAPHAQPHIVAAIADHWDEVSAKYGLTNRNRAIGFLSTAYEESGGFTVLSENLMSSKSTAQGRLMAAAARFLRHVADWLDDLFVPEHDPYDDGSRP